MSSFAVTWDYRCPFAGIAHRHVLAGLRDGASWEVRFVPFSLKQMHVPDGEPPVWEAPETDSGLLALQVGVAVRDRWPDRFPVVHEALFLARHGEGLDLRDEHVLRSVLDSHDVDAEAAFEEVRSGRPLEVVQAEHSDVVARHGAWGVPTFVAGEEAVFVRLMEPPTDDPDGRATVERILELLEGWPQLNEFKHPTISR